MRRLVAWVLDGLPFDPRSRRAVDETMLDWAHEDAERSRASATSRWLVTVRGFFAVARALVFGAVVEADVMPFGWLGIRLALFSAVPALAIATLVLVPVQSPGLRAPVAALLTPAIASVFFPLAILSATAWRTRRRDMPVLGTAFVGAVVSVLLAAVASFMEDLVGILFEVRVDRSGGDLLIALSRAPAISVSSAIVAAAQRWIDGFLGGIPWLVGFALSCAAAGLLGSVLVTTGRSARFRSAWWLAAAAVGYLGVIVATTVVDRALNSRVGDLLLTAVMVWVALRIGRPGRRHTVSAAH